MTATVKRVEHDSHTVSGLTPTTICQSLLALNMAGVKPNKQEFGVYARELAKEEKLRQLSGEERAVLDTLCRKI